jgi:hypothetical protein
VSTTRISAWTTLSPGNVVDALTDFSAQRPDQWPGNDQRRYHVHDRGPDWADVTEGSSRSGGVWQRVHYDWATPGLVRLNVIDSNAFGHGSYWEYHVDEAEGGSRVTLTVHRQPSTVKGRLLDAVLAIAGRWVFGADLRHALRRLEGCASSGSP